MAREAIPVDGSDGGKGRRIRRFALAVVLWIIVLVVFGIRQDSSLEDDDLLTKIVGEDVIRSVVEHRPPPVTATP